VFIRKVMCIDLCNVIGCLVNIKYSIRRLLPGVRINVPCQNSDLATGRTVEKSKSVVVAALMCRCDELNS
jgi:hypothetical protein